MNQTEGLVQTYIDTGVLIAAWRGEKEIAQKALQIFDDPKREILLSDAVRLKVFPKTIYNRREEERRFLEQLFQTAAENLAWEKVPFREIYKLACQYGLGAMDALHLALALHVGAKEFVTTEKPTHPLFRCRDLAVVFFGSV